MPIYNFQQTQTHIPITMAQSGASQYRKLLIKQWAEKYHCHLKLPSRHPILDCRDPSSNITSNSLLECDWTMQNQWFSITQNNI